MNYAYMKAKAEKEWKALMNLPQPLIEIGMGTCGRAAGAEKVLHSVERTLKLMGSLYRILEVGCIGMCYLEPLMAVRKPGGPFIYYGDLTPERAEEIVRSYLSDGDPIPEWAVCTFGDGSLEGIPRFSEHPMIRSQVRIVLRNCGVIDPQNIDHYIAHGGYEGLQKALQMEADQVIREVKESGLRGRGGAGFPTGLKWEFASKALSETKYFICNADEGDPGAFMDRSVLEGDPHAVLEGMLIGAYAIGATEGYIYIRAEYPLAIQRLTTALKQMEDYGILGKNILGSTFHFDIHIKEGAGAFVCGEETAMMASIEGARGMPRPRPPFPAQEGLWGKPTNINNVETLANVSAILQRGAKWFASFGTEKSKGTKTFSIAGKVNRTGLIEVPMGIKLGDIIYEIGGGVPKGKKLKAIQTGGPSGGCIPPELLNLPVDYESLAQAGSIMGSGGMVVMDDDTCMVDMARYFLTFTQSESCGKCTPCRLGTNQMLSILDDISQGRGKPEDLDLLKYLSEAIQKGSLCGLGQTAPNPVLTTLRYFESEYQAHIKDKRCPAAVCAALFESPCQHICPVGMEVPAYVALVRAGRIEDAYKVLKRSNPFPSICGRVCGHLCQNKCRRGQLDESVAVMNIKRFITDHAARPKVEPIPISRTERIAVIGAGPSGLTAALELKKRGYAVTVFEELPQSGGMLRYGIPAYRLPREVLDREIQDILDTGIELRINTRVGQKVTLEELDRSYEFIYLAVGAHKSSPLAIPGEYAEGVFGAVEMLRAYNAGQKLAVGRRVAVIGGGNSAVDAARTAVRLGADTVTIFYRRERKDMLAQESEIEAAEEEGVRIEYLVAPLEVVTSDGKVAGLKLARMRLGQFDRSGRKQPQPIPGSEFVADVDMVISAVGQTPDLAFVSEKSGIGMGRIGVTVNEDLQTTNTRVWAGGDAVTGPAWVIDAIKAGQDAARAIDAFIRTAKGEKPWVASEEEEIEIPFEVDKEIVEHPQVAMPEVAAEQRRHDFREVELGYTLEMAMAEARRCMRCDAQIE
jgi:NADH-quinone oxidoreductase subunit F